MDKYFFIITFMSSYNGPQIHATMSGTYSGNESPEERYLKIYGEACTKYGLPSARTSVIFYHSEKI